MTHHDSHIDHRPVALATRDYGGTGPAILLLHGGGSSLSCWDTVAPMLVSGHHVVAMDLRGHGRSGDGDWETEAVVDDIDAVIEHHGLSRPVVVGHSLGGMLAGAWGRRHPDAVAVVSLDGHRSADTAEANYHGMPPAQRDHELVALRALFDRQTEALGLPLPAEAATMLPARQIEVRDGLTFARPNLELAATLRRSADFRDSLPIFGEVECPMLLVLATRDLPHLTAEFEPLMAAHRAGLRHDLATLGNPSLRTQEIDASHNMLSEAPQAVAELIAGFVAER